ncbi:FapA family protein, partial [Thermosulfuriphilus sp.]
LIINGNIKRGFSLHVEGDLEIKGSVEDNVKIFVSGDLYVGGIIQGEILIECKGNATINALEYGHIQVSGNLVVLDYLLQPFCLVGKNFRLLEGLGVILGGKCLVGGSAEVYILGNEAHVRADFRVGYDPHIFDKLADIRQRKLTLQQQRRDLSKVLEKGTKLLKEGKLSLDKINLVNKIKQFLGDINNELRRTSLEEKLLAKTFKKLRNNTLRIERRIFPGVHIGIADADLSIITRLGGGTFFLREEGISFRPASG